MSELSFTNMRISTPNETIPIRQGASIHWTKVKILLDIYRLRVCSVLENLKGIYYSKSKTYPQPNGVQLNIPLIN